MAIADQPSVPDSLGTVGRLKSRQQAIPDQVFPVGEYTGFTKLIKGLRHAHQTSDRFSCELRIDKLSLRVPMPTKVQAEWCRGPKRLITETKQTLHKGVWICSWPVPLVLDQVTLFHNSGSSRVYRPKESILKFTEASKPTHVLGEVSVDLSEVAETDTQQKTVTLPLHKTLDPTATVTLTVSMRQLLHPVLSDGSDVISLGPSGGLTTSAPSNNSKGGSALALADSPIHEMIQRRATQPPVASSTSPTVEPVMRRASQPPLDSHASMSHMHNRLRDRIRGRRLRVPIESSDRYGADHSPHSRKWYRRVRGRHYEEDAVMLRGRQSLPNFQESSGATGSPGMAHAYSSMDLGLVDQERSPTMRRNSLQGKHDQRTGQGGGSGGGQQIKTLDQVLKDVEISSPRSKVRLEKKIGDILAALQEAQDRAEVFEKEYTSRRAKLIEELDNLPLSNAIGTLEKEILTKNDELIDVQSKRIAEKQKLTDDLRETYLRLRATDRELKQLQATVTQLKAQNEQLQRKINEGGGVPTSEPSEVVTLVFSPEDSSADAKYQSMTKSELVARIRRLEAATCVKSAQQVAELEEELIHTKVKLAQAETEKERFMEDGRHGIRQLKTELDTRSKAVEELEVGQGEDEQTKATQNQLTDLKLSQKPLKVKPGAANRAASILRTATKGFKRRKGGTKNETDTA